MDCFHGTTWASGYWGFVGLAQDAHVVPSNGFDQNTRANCEPMRITKLVYHIGKWWELKQIANLFQNLYTQARTPCINVIMCTLWMRCVIIVISLCWSQLLMFTTSSIMTSTITVQSTRASWLAIRSISATAVHCHAICAHLVSRNIVSSPPSLAVWRSIHGKLQLQGSRILSSAPHLPNSPLISIFPGPQSFFVQTTFETKKGRSCCNRHPNTPMMTVEGPG